MIVWITRPMYVCLVRIDHVLMNFNRNSIPFSAFNGMFSNMFHDDKCNVLKKILFFSNINRICTLSSVCNLLQTRPMAISECTFGYIYRSQILSSFQCLDRLVHTCLYGLQVFFFLLSICRIYLIGVIHLNRNIMFYGIPVSQGHSSASYMA